MKLKNIIIVNFVSKHKKDGKITNSNHKKYQDMFAD